MNIMFCSLTVIRATMKMHNSALEIECRTRVASVTASGSSGPTLMLLLLPGAEAWQGHVCSTQATPISTTEICL